MASLWKHPKSPYFMACYTDRNGKQCKKSTKQTNRNKAMQVAMDLEHLESEAKKGTLTQVQIQKVMNELSEKVTGDSIVAPTTENFLNEWLSTKAAKGAASGTIERYGNTVKLFLKHLEENKKKPISSITIRHMDAFLTARLSSGVAPKTAIVDLKTLRSAFNVALKHSVIITNPVLAVDLPQSNSMQRDIFSHEEINMLIAEVQEDPEWEAVIMFGYFTGARLSDCACMKWENIDLVRCFISFTPTKTKRTGKVLTIPMHPELKVVLEALAKSVKEPRIGFISPKLAARSTSGKSGLSESFKRIVTRAGIDTNTVQGKGHRKFSKRSFHSLRYSFNTVLAKMGVSQELRVKLTGHSSFAMNDRYTKFPDKNLKDAIGMMPLLSQKVEDDEGYSTPGIAQAR